MYALFSLINQPLYSDRSTLARSVIFLRLTILLFAGLDAMQVRVQTQVGAFVPYQVFLMLPYVLSILAMVLVSRKARYPKALLVPYRKGERI